MEMFWEKDQMNVHCANSFQGLTQSTISSYSLPITIIANLFVFHTQSLACRSLWGSPSHASGRKLRTRPNSFQLSVYCVASKLQPIKQDLPKDSLAEVLFVRSKNQQIILSRWSILNKVNICLARYSPRAKTTNQPTNRAPNKTAWPGPNWPKMPILGQI